MCTANSRKFRLLRNYVGLTYNLEVGGDKMRFTGIAKEFSLLNENQYNTIGGFWNEMASLYGLENLQGLGYKWENNKIFYAIGLKIGDIKDYNICIELPDTDWTIVNGETKSLKKFMMKSIRSLAH